MFLRLFLCFRFPQANSLGLEGVWNNPLNFFFFTLIFFFLVFFVFPLILSQNSLVGFSLFSFRFFREIGLAPFDLSLILESSPSLLFSF